MRRKASSENRKEEKSECYYDSNVVSIGIQTAYRMVPEGGGFWSFGACV